MVGVILQKHKPKFEVKPPGSSINGVHLHRPDTDNIRNMLCPPQGIDQEKRAQTLSLRVPIHRQSAQQQYRHINRGQSLRLIDRECFVPYAV